MATTQFWTDIDGMKLSVLKDWRLNPLTTVQRTQLGLTLGPNNIGLYCFDTDDKLQYVWDGTAWTSGVISGGGPETDPVFTAWLAIPPAVSIFTNDAGYLTSYTETDPIWIADKPNYSTTAQADLFYYPLSSNPAGYLTSFSETDPVFGTWLAGPPNLSEFNDNVGYAVDANVLHTTGNETKSGILTLNDTPVAPGYSIPLGTSDQVLLADGSTTDYNTIASGGQTEVFYWRFNTSTTASDPGTGKFRFDQTTVASITNIYIDDFTDFAGIDISAMFSQINGQWLIHIQEAQTATNFVQFTTGTPYIDNTGWWTIPVTYIQSGGLPFGMSNKCAFVFINQNGAATGGVTSVGLEQNGGIALPSSAFTISNSPITTGGNLSIDWQGMSTDLVLGTGQLQSMSSIGLSNFTNDAGYITSTGITPSALTKTDDTNVTLALTGTPATALLQGVNIAAGWTGTLADARIASSANWNTAFGWGNHAAAGYLTTSAAASLYQPVDGDLSAIAALGFSSSSFLIKTAANTWTLDTNTYLTTGAAAATYQPVDGDLTTIAGLTATTDNFIVSVASAWASRTPAQVRTTLGLVIGTNVQAWDGDLDAIAALGFASTSFLTKTAANTWALDTNTYLTTSSAASTYQPLDATLTALAGLATGASKVPYSTGTDAFSQLTLDIDGTLAANSDTTLATQKATKTYADTKVAKSQATYTLQANNTNATANMTDQVFKDIGAQAIGSGTPAWTAGTPPSGAENHQYAWTQIGKMVTLFFYLTYVSPGATCTVVSFALPADMPAPLELAGTGAATDFLYMGSGYIGTAKTTSPAVTARVTIQVNSGDTGWNVVTTGTSVAARVAWGSIQYKAA